MHATPYRVQTVLGAQRGRNGNNSKEGIPSFVAPNNSTTCLLASPISTDRKEVHIKQMQLRPSTNEVLIADSADSADCAEYQWILASRRLTLTAFVHYEYSKQCSGTADVPGVKADQQHAHHPRSPASRCCHTKESATALHKLILDSRDWLFRTGTMQVQPISITAGRLVLFLRPLFQPSPTLSTPHLCYQSCEDCTDILGAESASPSISI